LLHNGSISLFGISIDSPKLKCFCWQNPGFYGHHFGFGHHGYPGPLSDDWRFAPNFHGNNPEFTQPETEFYYSQQALRFFEFRSNVFLSLVTFFDSKTVGAVYKSTT
jgi:hypothetical protein